MNCLSHQRNTMTKLKILFIRDNEMWSTETHTLMVCWNQQDSGNN